MSAYAGPDDVALAGHLFGQSAQPCDELSGLLAHGHNNTASWRPAHHRIVRVRRLRPSPAAKSGPTPSVAACRVEDTDVVLCEESTKGVQVEDPEALVGTRHPREETVRRGREIYERDIRRQVEAGHHGEVVAIDVDSGSWVVADGEVAAVDRLRAMCPGAVNVLCERVGYRALRSFGAGSVRRVG